MRHLTLQFTIKRLHQLYESENTGIEVLCMNSYTSLWTWLLVPALVLSGVSLAWTEELSTVPVTLSELKARYPGAVFREVTPEEFDATRTNGQTRILILVDTDGRVMLPEPGPSDEALSVPEGALPELVEEDPNNSDRSTYPNYADSIYYDNYGYDANCTGIFVDMDMSADSEELAVIIFIVAGVVVVGAALLYLPAFAYQAATHREGYPLDGRLEGRASWLAGGDRSGGLYGAEFILGFRDRYTHFGLGIEGGYLDLAARVEGLGEPVDLSGGYIMAGPSWRYYPDPGPNAACLYAEVLAGTAGHEEVGLLSAARLGVGWGWGPYLRMGLHVGGLYAERKEVEGELADDGNFNLLLGGELGFRY